MRGRVAVCSHGDVIPALVTLLMRMHGLEKVPWLERRGGWYSLRIPTSGIPTIEVHQAVPDIPTRSIGCTPVVRKRWPPWQAARRRAASLR